MCVNSFKEQQRFIIHYFFIAGSRLFSAGLSGISFNMNFWPQLLSQSYIVYIIRGNPSLCSTQLMMDQVTIHRLRVFMYLISQILLPTANFDELLPPGCECAFIFTLLHLYFGITLPMLLAVTPKTTTTISIHPLDEPPRFRPGPSKIILWWAGLIVTWAITVFITSMTARNVY